MVFRFSVLRLVTWLVIRKRGEQVWGNCKRDMGEGPGVRLRPGSVRNGVLQMSGMR